MIHPIHGNVSKWYYIHKNSCIMTPSNDNANSKNKCCRPTCTWLQSMPSFEVTTAWSGGRTKNPSPPTPPPPAINAYCLIKKTENVFQSNIDTEWCTANHTNRCTGSRKLLLFFILLNLQIGRSQFPLVLYLLASSCCHSLSFSNLYRSNSWKALSSAARTLILWWHGAMPWHDGKAKIRWK